MNTDNNINPQQKEKSEKQSRKRFLSRAIDHIEDELSELRSLYFLKKNRVEKEEINSAIERKEKDLKDFRKDFAEITK